MQLPNFLSYLRPPPLLPPISCQKCSKVNCISCLHGEPWAGYKIPVEIDQALEKVKFFSIASFFIFPFYQTALESVKNANLEQQRVLDMRTDSPRILQCTPRRLHLVRHIFQKARVTSRKILHGVILFISVSFTKPLE